MKKGKEIKGKENIFVFLHHHIPLIPPLLGALESRDGQDMNPLIGGSDHIGHILFLSFYSPVLSMS